MGEFFREAISYAIGIDFLEFTAVIFGFLAVWFLIKENILTWPSGIIYIIISFVIFWRIQLYGDFLLHVFFLVLNIYGWYYWINAKKSEKEEVPVTTFSFGTNMTLLAVTALGVVGFGWVLQSLPYLFEGMEPAALPYWDATTSILSVTGMWLTTRKKIENWYYWLVVDVLATGIYIYKGIYFYALLYAIYIGLAFWGYLAWRKSLLDQTA